MPDPTNPERRPPRANVAQPPPAVRKQSLIAKPAKEHYRRNLPHIQAESRTLFVTFATRDRWHLPESVRNRLMQHCLHDHRRKLDMHGLVIMPDHAHMIFTPRLDSAGAPFGLAEIMHGIKGASAHTINKLLHRRGPVWQNESWDHVLRHDKSLEDKVKYICENPVRAGLVKTVDDYPWLWREWINDA
jgi:REP element-mobilizing transposase RayT